MSQLHVLLIDHSEEAAGLILRELHQAGYEPSWERVDTPLALRAALLRRTWDLITCAWVMPAFSGPAALQLLREQHVDAVTIVVSGQVGEEVAVTAMKAGAQDFVTKHRLSRLCPAVERELRERDRRRTHLRTEQALRLSDEILSHVSEGVSLIGISDGVILYNNPRFEQMLGYSPGELLGRHVSIVNAPTDKSPEETTREIVAALHTDGRWEGEVHNRRKDGTTFWSHASVSTFAHAEFGTVWVSVQRDITERKRLQEHLLRTKTFLDSIVENIPDMVFVKDARSLTYVLFNRAGAEFLGYKRADLIGKSDYDLFPKAEADFFTEKDRAVLRSKTLLDIPEEPIETGQHGERIVHTKKIPILDDQGEPAYLLGISEDITERRRVSEQLRESEERFSTAFEHAPIAMALIALDGHALRVNRALCHMLGYEREELLEMRPWDSTHPEDMLTTLEQLQRMVLGETDSWQLEKRYRHKRGHEVWGFSHTSIVRDEHGTPLYVISQVQDITERRHAEQTQRRHERETTVVNGILRAINTHFDVKAVFSEVCAGLRELAGCAAVGLNLFDESREWLSFVAADTPWPLGQDTRLRAAELPGLAAVLAGRPHVVRDLAAEFHFPIVRAIHAIGFRSVIRLPLCAGSDVVGILNLYWREVDGCQSRDMGPTTQVANALAIAVEKGRLFEQVSAGQERLARLSQRLMEVQETERRHLARELHDEIGQYLTGISLLLSEFKRRPLDSLIVPLDKVLESVNDLIMRVRDLSLDLRPPMLDDLGLLPALLWLVERFSRQTSIAIDFRHRGLDRRFPQDVETAAYRIVQEALANVARHADVSQAQVHASTDDHRLNVVIADQGKGFDTGAELVSGTTSGLSGMRERVRILGGRLSIESGPGAGTQVRAEFEGC